MATKSILVALTDAETLGEITQALGDGWDVTSVGGDFEAVTQLAERSFDALLVDFNLGSPDASELLNHAWEKRPEMIRFLLAYEADLALVAAKVLGPHQLLPKPVEPASLKSRIDKGVAGEDANSDPSGTETATGTGAAPAVPPVYAEVLTALELPEVTNEQVGAIIARDEALTAELLRLTNSAYLGLPRNLTDPAEAVASLGLGAVKALIMALRFLAEHSRLKPGYLSFEKIWQHSVNVAQVARDLVLFETKDRALAAEAFTAGLLHDLGKVVLVSNFDDLYGRVHSLARKQPVPIWEIEKEMFGASHGEIGGCLVGMWNLPSAIVEAVALHHEPPLGEHDRLTPLAAVHIANVLEHELRPSDEFRVSPIMATAFLNEIGLLQRLPIWRAAFANHELTNPDLEVESAETTESGMASTARSSHTGNQLRGPARATRTATAGQQARSAVQASSFWRRRWVYAGVAAVLLFLLALRLGNQSELNSPEPVSARSPAPAEADATVPLMPSPGIAPATVPQATPAVAVSDEAPETKASVPTVAPSATLPKPAPSVPVPEPAPAIAPHATVASVPPSSPAPKAPAPPEFRLSGIFYTVLSPSAIVNGETVNVGDQVNGATVISIGRTAVVLQVNGKRKTYVLH